MGDIVMKIDESILNDLYVKAKESFDDNEIPVAAAIFDQNNNLISIAGNNRQGDCNVLGHAEINCILEAEKKIGDWRLDGYYMVVTLEPCDMCSLIISESRLDKVLYFLPKKVTSKYDIKINKQEIDEYDEFKKKLNDLLTVFFENMR